MQLTAGSITGRFGSRPVYWSERMLDEGLAHIVASDAHDPVHRRPAWRDALEALREQVGSEETHRLVRERPAAIIADVAPSRVQTPVVAKAEAADTGGSLWGKLMGALGGRR